MITSTEAQRYPPAVLLACRRGYWAIEAKLHQRLDISLDEDRSRLRTPKGLFVLGLFRRAAQFVPVRRADTPACASCANSTCGDLSLSLVHRRLFAAGATIAEG